MNFKKACNILISLGGVFYSIAHFIFFSAFAYLTVVSIIDGMQPDLELLVIVIPFIGILAGWWIYKRRFGWVRSLVIVLSLTGTVGLLLLMIFVFPQIK